MDRKILLAMVDESHNGFLHFLHPKCWAWRDTIVTYKLRRLEARIHLLRKWLYFDLVIVNRRVGRCIIVRSIIFGGRLCMGIEGWVRLGFGGRGHRKFILEDPLVLRTQPLVVPGYGLACKKRCNYKGTEDCH
jgi:hypothetical protein